MCNTCHFINLTTMKGKKTMVEKKNTFEIPEAPGGGLPAFQIFFDLDGVFADFQTGWKEIFGEAPPRKPTEEQWEHFIANTGFLNLQEMPFAPELYKLLTPGECTPFILTGAPRSFLGEAEAQKKAWCREHLGVASDRVIVCRSYMKPAWAAKCRKEGVIPILLDDTPRTRTEWENAGGIFVLYKTPDHIREVWDLENRLGSLCNFSREWGENESGLGDLREAVWIEFRQGLWNQAAWVGEPRPHTPKGMEIMATRFGDVVKWALIQVRKKEEAERIAKPLVTGADLRLLGYSPGPHLGKALRAAQALQDSGERDYATLLRVAEEVL